MKHLLIILSVVLLFPSYGFSQDTQEEQHAIDRYLLLGESAPYGSTPSSCLSDPLPTVPKNPKYTLTHSLEGDTVQMKFWREPCQSGTGTALLMRAVPKLGIPFVCGTGFTVVQDGVQHNNVLLQSTTTSLGWCSDLYTPTTFIVNEYEFGQAQFDPAKKMKVIYDVVTRASVKIPAGTPVQSDVSGTATGYAGANVSCKNTSTGQSVSIPLQAGVSEWDCAVAGLKISAGDKIKVVISGAAK